MRPVRGQGERMGVVIGIVIGVAAGIGAAVLGLRLLSGSRLDAARRTRAILLEEAKREAEATRREAQIEAREQSVKLRAEIEDEVRERRAQIGENEGGVVSKEEEIDPKLTEGGRGGQGIGDTEKHPKQKQEKNK